MIFPESEDQMMRAMWPFPGAFGGIDGCHTATKCPHGGDEARKEYYNFKKFYSIVIMGIVAADYIFLLAICWISW